jgi:hypothetical protein
VIPRNITVSRLADVESNWIYKLLDHAEIQRTTRSTLLGRASPSILTPWFEMLSRGERHFNKTSALQPHLLRRGLAEETVSVTMISVFCTTILIAVLVFGALLWHHLRSINRLPFRNDSAGHPASISGTRIPTNLYSPSVQSVDIHTSPLGSRRSGNSVKSKGTYHLRDVQNPFSSQQSTHSHEVLVANDLLDLQEPGVTKPEIALDRASRRSSPFREQTNVIRNIRRETVGRSRPASQPSATSYNPSREQDHQLHTLPIVLESNAKAVEAKTRMDDPDELENEYSVIHELPESEWAIASGSILPFLCYLKIVPLLRITHSKPKHLPVCILDRNPFRSARRHLFSAEIVKSLVAITNIRTGSYG